MMREFEKAGKKLEIFRRLRLLVAAFVCAGVTGASMAMATPIDDEIIDGGDLNGDGWHDVVILDAHSNTISALDYKTGQKIWSYVYNITSPVVGLRYNKEGLTKLKDIDKDKINDFAFADTESDAIYFISGKTGNPTPGVVLGSAGFPNGKENAFGAAIAQLHDNIDFYDGADIIVSSPREIKDANYAFGTDVCAATGEQNGTVYAVSSRMASETLFLPPIWSTQGPAGSTHFGWDVIPLSRDYSGDGIKDILVSDPCKKYGRGDAAGRGALYILSGKTGAILKEFKNPVTLGAAADKTLFGYDILETQDLDSDGSRDFVVGAPNALGTGGDSAVLLLSGKNGALLCHYPSPNKTGDRFGWSLAGGNFTLGDPTNTVYNFFSPPHDVLVGAPEAKKAYLLRLDGTSCVKDPLIAEWDGSEYNFGNRVEVLIPPYIPYGMPGNYVDLLVGSHSLIDRYSGKDGSFAVNYPY